jgi:hypothetical protein
LLIEDNRASEVGRALWIQAYGGYARVQRAKIAAWLLD